MSECTARQYHRRFNIPAVPLQRLMVQTSFKNQRQTQRSQKDCTGKKLKHASQEFKGLFEFIASICWGTLC